MLKRAITITILLVACAGLIGPADAQEPEPQPVTLDAPDGLTLVGSYYAPTAAGDQDAPAILLLHQAASRKEAWYPVIAPLLDAGYGVLTVDQRGHGRTGGKAVMPAMEQDVQLWLDWLREQPGIDPNRLNLMGASIGANLALRGMANDPDVVTAIALSPGLNYMEATTEDAITSIGERPVYLVAAQGDEYSAQTVRRLASIAQGDTLLRIYTRNVHGTGLFMIEDDLTPSIVSWLDIHNR